MHDLGPLDGPVMVFGGPYSNRHATQALRHRAEALSIPPHRVICTGDVVAYGADAQRTVDLVRDWAIPVVMGNCEEALGHQADDCGCGFAEGSACDTLSAQWYAHAARQLDENAQGWMRSLPRAIRFSLGPIRFAVVHGAARNISRFLFASSPDQDFQAEMAIIDADIGLGGHCGLPFDRPLGDGRLWHNPGVIGMPANDGTPRGWFSVITPTRDGVKIARHALSYDHAGAAHAMRAVDLPSVYADSLETGLWPNMDVLPPAERALQGMAITEQSLFWPDRGT